MQAATLKERQPMCTGQFVAWHHQFIMADRSPHRQIIHTMRKIEWKWMYSIVCVCVYCHTQTASADVADELNNKTDTSTMNDR